MRAGIVVTVTPKDRRRLEAVVRDRNRPQKHVWQLCAGHSHFVPVDFRTVPILQGFITGHHDHSNGNRGRHHLLACNGFGTICIGRAANGPVDDDRLHHPVGIGGQ